MEPRVDKVHPGICANSLTFVPGTWANGWFNTVVLSRLQGLAYTPPDAGVWFDVDSQFSTSIKARDFRCFTLRWSGRNSVADRRKAAEILAVHLHDLLTAAPESKHYVIAHSHGGNVATMALATFKEPEMLGHIYLATMSTPFVWTRTRGALHIATVAKFILFWTSAALLAVPASIALLYSQAQDIDLGPLGGPHYDSAHWLASDSVAAILSSLLLWAASPVVNKAVKRIAAATDSVLEESDRNFALNGMQSLGKVLILQPPDDEAWLALSQPSFAVWANRVVGAIVAKIAGTFGYALLTATLIAMLVVGFFIVIATQPNFPLNLVLFIVLVLLALLLSIKILQGLFLGILGTFGALVLKSIGYDLKEGLILALCAEVHLEHYPPGKVCQIFCPFEPASGLNHFLYNSSEVQQAVASWIKDEANADDLGCSPIYRATVRVKQQQLP